MSTAISYREANPQDAESVAALSLKLQEEYAFPEYSDAGRQRMRQLSSASATRDCLERGDMYILAECNQRLVGAIGVRDRSHIVQLFVDTRWQRQGIGTKLWRLAQAACLGAGGNGVFTLNASSFAIPMYEKLGFRRMGTIQDREGVVTTPMRYEPTV